VNGIPSEQLPYRVELGTFSNSWAMTIRWISHGLVKKVSPDLPVMLLYRAALRGPGVAKNLDGLIHIAEGYFRGKYFGHGGIHGNGLYSVIFHPGPGIHRVSRCSHLGRHFRQFELDRLES